MGVRRRHSPLQRSRPPWGLEAQYFRRKDGAGQRASESSVKGRRMTSSRPTVSTMTAHSFPVALHASATLRSDCLWYATGPQVRSTRTAVHPAFSSSTSVATSRQGGPSVTQTAQKKMCAVDELRRKQPPIAEVCWST